MPNFKYKSYKIEDFLDMVKLKQERSVKYDPDFYYSVYVTESNSEELVNGMVLYISDPVNINENDEEVYPVDVASKGLVFAYSCDNFQDVVDLAVRQDANVSCTKLIQCLNHYSRNDNFLDI